MFLETYPFFTKKQDNYNFTKNELLYNDARALFVFFIVV